LYSAWDMSQYSIDQTDTCAYDILPYNYIISKQHAELFFRLDILQAWYGATAMYGGGG